MQSIGKVIHKPMPVVSCLVAPPPLLILSGGSLCSACLASTPEQSPVVEHTNAIQSSEAPPPIRQGHQVLPRSNLGCRASGEEGWYSFFCLLSVSLSTSSHHTQNQVTSRAVALWKSIRVLVVSLYTFTLFFSFIHHLRTSFTFRLHPTRNSVSRKMHASSKQGTHCLWHIKRALINRLFANQKVPEWCSKITESPLLSASVHCKTVGEERFILGRFQSDRRCIWAMLLGAAWSTSELQLQLPFSN